MYQQCPNCKGSGREYSIGTTVTHIVCTVCKGTKIIDTVTGLPPQQHQELTPKAFEQHRNQIGKEFKNDIEK